MATSRPTVRRQRAPEPAADVGQPGFDGRLQGPARDGRIRSANGAACSIDGTDRAGHLVGERHEVGGALPVGVDRRTGRIGAAEAAGQFTAERGGCRLEVSHHAAVLLPGTVERPGGVQAQRARRAVGVGQRGHVHGVLYVRNHRLQPDPAGEAVFERDRRDDIGDVEADAQGAQRQGWSGQAGEHAERQRQPRGGMTQGPGYRGSRSQVPRPSGGRSAHSAADARWRESPIGAMVASSTGRTRCLRQQCGQWAQR